MGEGNGERKGGVWLYSVNCFSYYAIELNQNYNDIVLKKDITGRYYQIYITSIQYNIRY